MEIRIAEVDSDLELVGSLLIQLRPSYDLRILTSQAKYTTVKSVWPLDFL